MTDKELIELEKDIVDKSTKTTIGAAIAVCAACVWVAWFLGSKLSSIEVALLSLNDRVAFIEKVFLDDRYEARKRLEELLRKNREGQ